MTIRGVGLTLGVTTAVLAGIAAGTFGAAQLLLSQRYEDWQAKRATGLKHQPGKAR